MTPKIEQHQFQEKKVGNVVWNWEKNKTKIEEIENFSKITYVKEPEPLITITKTRAGPVQVELSLETGKLYMEELLVINFGMKKRWCLRKILKLS